jgi:hypothetical protein
LAIDFFPAHPALEIPSSDWVIHWRYNQCQEFDLAHCISSVLSEGPGNLSGHDDGVCEQLSAIERQWSIALLSFPKAKLPFPRLPK